MRGKSETGKMMQSWGISLLKKLPKTYLCPPLATHTFREHQIIPRQEIAVSSKWKAQKDEGYSEDDLVHGEK